MRPYEAIIIFSNKLSEENISTSISKFEKKIKDNGGTDINVTKWGIKKLAAKLKRAKNAGEGYYVLINFNGEGKTPNELKSIINVSEGIIGYSVICSRPPEKEIKEEKVEIASSMIVPQGETSA